MPAKGAVGELARRIPEEEQVVPSATGGVLAEEDADRDEGTIAAHAATHALLNKQGSVCAARQAATREGAHSARQWTRWAIARRAMLARVSAVELA